MLILDDKKIFYFIAAAFYLAVSFALYPVYSADFFAIQQASDRFSTIINGDLRSGRFFGATFIYLTSFVNIDPIKYYPLYLAGSSIAVASFINQLYFHYLRLNTSLPFYIFFCFSFFFSGAMFDLLSFREIPHHTLLIFLLGYFYLKIDNAKYLWFVIIIKSILVIFLFGTYQSSVIMILLLSIMRFMFDCLDGTSFNLAFHRVVRDLVVILVGLSSYIVINGAVEHHFSLSISRTIIDYHDPAVLYKRFFEHNAALLKLFYTPGQLYMWSHVGLGLLVACVGFAIHATTLGRWRAIASLISGLIMVSLLQNPMNFLLSSYWPTLRSSFYVALVPGLLIAYVYSRSRFPFVLRTGPYILTVLFSVYATAAMIVLSEVYELRKRDNMLVHDIITEFRNKVKSNVVHKIRMPLNKERMSRTYYSNLEQLRFDIGTPLMMISWSTAQYINYKTGIYLIYDPIPAACLENDIIPRLNVFIENDVVNVCF